MCIQVRAILWCDGENLHNNAGRRPGIMKCSWVAQCRRSCTV